MSFILLVVIAIYICPLELGREIRAVPEGTLIVFLHYPALLLRAACWAIMFPPLRGLLPWPPYQHCNPNLGSCTGWRRRFPYDPYPTACRGAALPTRELDRFDSTHHLGDGLGLLLLFAVSDETMSEVGCFLVAAETVVSSAACETGCALCDAAFSAASLSAMSFSAARWMFLSLASAT